MWMKTKWDMAKRKRMWGRKKEGREKEKSETLNRFPIISVKTRDAPKRT
jgi:hypothetical protein